MRMPEIQISCLFILYKPQTVFTVRSAPEGIQYRIHGSI